MGRGSLGVFNGAFRALSARIGEGRMLWLVCLADVSNS